MQPNSSVYIIYICINYHKIVEVMAETLIKVRTDISCVFYAVTYKTHQVLNKLR